jgi:hypothetical protein
LCSWPGAALGGVVYGRLRRPRRLSPALWQTLTESPFSRRPRRSRASPPGASSSGSHRRSPTVRSRNAAYAATLVVTLLGSATAIRFAPLVLVVAIPVLASAASRDWVTDYMRTRRVVLAPGAAALALVFLIMAIPALGHVGPPAPSLYPQEVSSRIPSGCRVFTSYLLGGFIELIRPDVRVNVDSRNDLFGEDRVLAADRTLQGRGDVTRALAGAACALVPPSSGLALRLNGDPAWRLAAAEGVAALYVRREP